MPHFLASRAFLRVLGRLAHLSRSIGLGVLLAISRDALDAIFIRIGRPPLRVSANGFAFYGYLRHRSFLEAIAAERYEAFCREIYRRSLKPGMLVVDGGAHIGLYSVIGSRLIGDTGKIFAFEPDPYNFRALAFNVEKNRCRNVVAVQKALSDVVGRAFFYQNPGTFASSLVTRTEMGRYRKVETETTTVDRELGDIEADSILIKLDLEGGEPRALQGSQRILGRGGPAVLLLETNPAALRDARFDAGDVYGELEKFRFRIYFIDELEARLVPITERSMVQKGNIYCGRDR